jgi:hypothetical protein
MSLLATRFSYRGLRKICRNHPLNEIEMRQVAPSIFAAEAHESRSARYAYVPTAEILNGLAQHGFRPFSACQSTCRTAGKTEYTKHLVRLRHADEINTSGAKEVIVINSHDGTSSLQLLGGWFESVCQNGLVVGKAGMDVRIKHTGDIIQETQSGAFEVLRTLKVIEENREEMLDISLCEDARRAFAKAVLMLRWTPDEDGNSKAPIQPDNLLAVRRREEQRDASTLWRTLNICQENALEGGICGRDANRRRVTTRPIKGIDQATTLNKAIWSLGEEMRNIMRRAA